MNVSLTSGAIKFMPDKLNLEKVFELAMEVSKRRDELTGEQFFDAILQAIESGDFLAYITIHRQEPVGEFDPADSKTHKAIMGQMVTYEPFRKTQDLMNQVSLLTQERQAIRTIILRVRPPTYEGDETLIESVEAVAKQAAAYLALK